jgi:hypothetical protein
VGFSKLQDLLNSVLDVDEFEAARSKLGGWAGCSSVLDSVKERHLTYLWEIESQFLGHPANNLTFDFLPDAGYPN